MDVPDNGPAGSQFATQFATLAELLANPSILDPPEAVVPRLAFRGHMTLLAAADKAGKTTLAAYAATEVMRAGRFLDEPTVTRHRRVLWLGLEESVKHAVRRFSQLGANPDRVTLVTVSGIDVIEAAQAFLESNPVDLVIVDSLQEYARVTTGGAPSDGDNGAWGGIVRPLVALARNYDVALVLLHHVRRSDLQARGAGEILAAADVLLEMAPKKNGDPRVRQITGRGRWDVAPFTIRLDEGGYRLDDGSEVSVEALVRNYVQAHPDCSRNEVCTAVGKKKQTVLAAINQLVNGETIAERNVGNGSALRIRDPEFDLEAA